MANMQLGSGSSSSTTHRLTQSSQTLDRRYVERPSNLAIEEAARSVHSSSTAPSSARPSRLVNLRVHASEMLQTEATEPLMKSSQVNSAIVPRVVEYGVQDDTQVVDLNQMVPEEAPIEPLEPVSYMPVLASETPLAPAETVAENTEDYSNYYYPESVDQGIVPISSTIVDTDSQALAMNIAADYAAASLGASMQNTPEASSTLTVGDNSIDAIAQATSEAIAAIRIATDPEEVAEQVTSLKAFAENIKASSSAPEMLELSSTIEKFVDVAMKSSRVQEEVQKKEALTLAEAAAAAKAKAAAKATKKSTFSKVSKVNKPSKTVAKKPAARPLSHSISRPAATPTAKRPVMRRTAKTATRSALVADEDQALRKALRSVAAMDDEVAEKSPRARRAIKKKGSGKRFALAFFCAIICVAGVVYFVGSNIPDISVRVAAMQTGIEASYPSYVPRDFSLSDISSEEGKITLTFKGPDKASFTLTEEKSSWDSTAVLRNYVEPNWSSDYITTHEQGITIYISDSNAAWVNGGVLYKIDTSGPGLTKKQLRNIVTSL